MTEQNRLAEALSRVGGMGSPDNKLLPLGSDLFSKPVLKDVYFNSKPVFLDGYRFEGCRFDNCKLHVAGLNFEMSHCVVDPSTQIVYGDRLAKVLRLFLGRYVWATDEIFGPFFMPTRHPDGTISIEEKGVS